MRYNKIYIKARFSDRAQVTKNQTVEDLKAIAVNFAKDEGNLQLACDLEQAGQTQSPTELRWRFARQDPSFTYTNSDLALQEAERAAR